MKTLLVLSKKPTKELLQCYKESLVYITDWFSGFNFTIYDICEYGKLIKVEDSFYIFLGIVETIFESYEDSGKQRGVYETLCREEPFRNILNQMVVAQELTYNKYKKVIKSRIFENLNKFGYFFDYNFFHGIILNDKEKYIEEIISKNYPIRNVNLSWRGYLYHFIIYEISNDCGEVIHAVSETVSEPKKHANKRVKMIKQKGYRTPGIVFQNTFFIDEDFSNKLKEITFYRNSNIKYYIIDSYVKDKSLILSLKRKVLKHVRETKDLSAISNKIDSSLFLS